MLHIKRFKDNVVRNISCCLTIIRTIHRNIHGTKFEDDVYVLDKLFSKGSTCIDIGANYGRFTLVMSRLVGANGQIYSFEPGQYSYKVLSSAVKFHRLKNVILVKKALSDKEGTTELMTPVKKTKKLGHALAYLKCDHKGESIAEKIETTTLDKYFFKENIKRIDFIKCDIEGAELLALRGARDVIVRYKPIMLCEVSVLALKEKFNSVPKQIYDFFCQLDYKAFILNKDKLKEIKNINRDSNYFFIHCQSEVLKKPELFPPRVLTNSI